MWKRRAASRSQLEIMIPLVGFKTELDMLAGAHRAGGRRRSRKERGKVPDYLIGTMIELPRAALARRRNRRNRGVLLLRHQRSDPDHAGHLRDDAGMFLSDYLTKGVIARDPFVSHRCRWRRRTGAIAAERGRKTRANLKLGICGEHGGDPDSIRFCHDSGLDYVSCSPFRVPVARLAAAQAALAAATTKLNPSTD